MILRRLMYVGLILAAQSTRGSREVQTLRAEGPAGLEKFLQTHSEALARGDRHAREALDKICAQHDCYTSKLYWYTDLEAAKARARAEHKPILSLHLLGRLDEELSCANSRFFRKILYADGRISALLRKQYVLHWKTVRPVPMMTIDFGDGRVLKRTITGNSIHYLLDSDGRPIDAIPGLVAPNTFLASLSAAEALAQELASLPHPDRMSVLKQWHQERIEQALVAWESDIRKLEPRAAIPRTEARARTAQLEKLSEGRWPTIGAVHQHETGVAPEVWKQIDPSAWKASQIAVTKMIQESPLFRQLRFSLAEDSVRNEYQLHRQIHEWLSNAQYTDVEALNARVYSQLFLAPLDDPWYGLKPAFAYSALEDTDGPSTSATTWPPQPEIAPMLRLAEEGRVRSRVILAPTPASESTGARSQR